MSTRVYYAVGVSSFFPVKKGRIVGVQFLSPLAASAATCQVLAGVLNYRAISPVSGTIPLTDFVWVTRFDGGMEAENTSPALNVPITEQTCLSIIQDAAGSAVIAVEE